MEVTKLDITVEGINQLQEELIIHSIIYYKFGESCWHDCVWDAEAMRLVGMKDTENFKLSKHYELFKDFEGETGMHLCLYEYTDKALDLLEEWD